ncbi:hypothetical protein DMENIID0001_054320 [Sergentomyia squamirostris]
MIIRMNRGKVFQILTAVVVNLQCSLFGLSMSWTSPAISILQSADTPLSIGPLSTEQISLMTALMYLGCVLGAILSGWLVNSAGRRNSMMILMIPQFVGVILILMTRNITCLYAFRILSGISGATSGIAPIFVSEISDKSLRGPNGNLRGITYNLGCFFGKILTSSFGYFATPTATFLLIIITLGIFLKLPDTPHYFLMKERPEEAKKSLKFYRGIPESHSMPPKVKEEFSELKNSPSLINQNVPLSIEDFKGSSTCLAIVITFFVTCNANFTGMRLITGYTETLLHESGSIMDTAIIDGALTGILIIVAIFTIAIVKIFGNRKVLMSCYFIVFVAEAIAGVHYYLSEITVDMADYWWIISLCITASLAFTGNGIVALSYVIPSEILPTKIRGFVFSAFSVLSWIIAFLLTEFYLPLANFWGHSVWMWLFAVFCFSGIIFTYFFIPETKDKTFDEIVELLKDKSKLNWKRTLNISKDSDI